MKYVLDTDHLSIIQERSGADYAMIVLHMSQFAESDVGVTVVSFHEQSLGCHTFINKAKTPERLRIGYAMLSRLIGNFRAMPVLDFDAPSIAVHENLKAARIRIGEMDLRIAAIARANNITLVTRNKSDFSQVPGLRIVDWTV